MHVAEIEASFILYHGAWSTTERVDRLLYRYVADYCSMMTVVPVSALHSLLIIPAN